MITQLVRVLDSYQEKDAAITLLEALERHASRYEEFDQLAESYYYLKEYIKAIKSAEQVIKLYPGNGDAYDAKTNLANLYNLANYPEKALAIIKRLKIIKPRDTSLQSIESFAYFLSNDKKKAEKILKNRMVDIPEDSEEYKRIYFNLGVYELERGNFKKGLQHFLIGGRAIGTWKKPELPFIFWDGEPRKNKTLIIQTEAGIGDEFINVRFIKNIEELGMKPIWFTNRKDMHSIFTRLGHKVVTNIKDLNYLEEDTYWCHSLDLPILLDLEEKDLWKEPYIKPDADLVDKYKEKLPNKKLKIGLRWRGNSGYDHDLHRSVPLSGIFEAVKHLDADFYSLQKEEGLEELGSLPIIDLEKNLSSFEDTLAIIANLDLVITSCTSIAHASAAMGKKTIVLVPISAYYIWCHTTEKSPWYGNHVTILRQEKPREWDKPFKQLNKIINEIL